MGILMAALSDSAAAPDVSLIIPVYNDGGRLALCLAAVARQTYPPAAVQIIVVDNASTEDIPAVTGRFPGVICAREEVRGPAAARNKGIALARGRVIAFTDADCIPAPDWLECGVARLDAEKGCGILGGRVDLAFADAARPAFAEIYDSVTYLQQKRHVERSSFAATANLFTYKAVFDAAGPFDVRFPSASGEDFEWGLRVRDHGYRLVYGDEVRVTHPATRTLGALCRKTSRIRDGLRRLRELRGPRAFSSLEAIKAFLDPGVVCSRILREDRIETLGRKAGVCAVAVYVHYASYWSRP
jgi:GT2 family glycosyltransferase